MKVGEQFSHGATLGRRDVIQTFRRYCIEDVQINSIMNFPGFQSLICDHFTFTKGALQKMRTIIGTADSSSTRMVETTLCRMDKANCLRVFLRLIFDDKYRDHS